MRPAILGKCPSELVLMGIDVPERIISKYAVDPMVVGIDCTQNGYGVFFKYC